MGEKPKVTLTAVEQALAEARSLLAGQPTVDSARERLGGRVATEPDVGQAVRVKSGLGVEHLGVVIFRRGEDVDVWLGAGRVRRLKESAVEPARLSELDKSLADIGGAAIVFASLLEGQRVRYRTPEGGAREGLLVEKCRYGALVLATDVTPEGGTPARTPAERVMAIGFSSLDPV